MRKKFSIYEIAFIIILSTLCIFILIEASIMVMKPTSKDNEEIRKQMMTIIDYICAGVMSILTAKLIKNINE